ncbi:G patch domain-containing protein 1 homolog [Penaeus indicus]|uniref:G patch domain-containing protein 1 homolog n=1 Tax=Penaeus indicus TaxID=29960 RepID=UPI00300D65B5
MSDSDDDYAFFGSPVRELDEDELRKQKVPRIEDQFAKDKQGRRRFHGAFSGGFSAGYFNSVGSKEGWTPSTFVSSRGQRADSKAARPQDFMDDEDLESYGISPQGIQATSSYDSNDPQKRKRVIDPDGPIPGVPVLEDILKPARETMGMKILQKLGWRPGQGVGPRVKRLEKVKAQKDKRRMYGCHFPSDGGDGDKDEDGDDDADCDSGVTYAPDDVETLYLPNPKQDQFGLGYKPLDRTPVLGGHINLFDPSPLSMKEKKKKVLIKGQAFGVGAFEDEDEDIYATEDMSNYDFGEEKKNAQKKNTSQNFQSPMTLLGLTEMIEGFKISTKPSQGHKIYPRPNLPKDFTPKHQPRKRRFERKENEVRGLGRHEMTPEQRARLLSDKSKTTVEFCYRYYLAQPKTMTEWEREREICEFNRAAQLFQPLTSTMANRFVTAATSDTGPVLKDGLNTEIPKIEPVNEEIEIDALGGNVADERIKAAKMNMFGKLTQVTVDWHPDRLLCRRFNVPNPYPESSFVGVRKTTGEKLSIFNVLNAPVEDTAGLQSKKSQTKSKADEDDQSEDDDDDDEDNDGYDDNKPETFGLKVPVDGPPTMDLFKAIFQDSDSESDDEEKNDAEEESDAEMSEVKEENTQRSFQSSSRSSKEVKNNDVNNPVMRSVTELVSTIRGEVNTGVSKEDEGLKDPKKKVRVSRFEPREEVKKEEDVPPKHIFIPRKKAPEPTESQPAKGIFANIDFEALNSYRKLDPETSKEQTDNISNDEGSNEAREKKDSDSSVDSEDEYGPPIPSHLKNRNQMIRSTPASVTLPRDIATKSANKDSPWIVKEVKSKSSKKHKHKDKHKHKKEKKKKKKQKEKKKKHRRRSKSDSSTDSSDSE